MAERVTAEEQLERILLVLPLAAREGGARLDELAGRLGVEPRQVLRDLEEVTARAYYHPAGGAEAIQILVERERVTVWTGGEFRRPVRLSPREALALGLGVRALAAEREAAGREALLALAARLEAELASRPAAELLPRFALDSDDDAVRGLLADSARDRQRVRIRYLKPGATSPVERVICPYVLVYAEGAWYVLAYCSKREGVRVFRVDRVLEGSRAGGGFDVPPDFDPAEYVTAGRLFRADEDLAVRVRYSPRIARWITERVECELAPDGSAVVCHRVADPRWLVRHVLQYGPDAEVLEPAQFRELVAAAAGRVAA